MELKKILSTILLPKFYGVLQNITNVIGSAYIEG